MTSWTKRRESDMPGPPPGRGDRRVPNGRSCIAVIGINRYRHWTQLDNAVNDARGVLTAFQKIGFEPIIEPLIDEAATSEALRHLPSLLSPRLQYNDNLIVFFAGHGHTTTTRCWFSADVDP